MIMPDRSDTHSPDREAVQLTHEERILCATALRRIATEQEQSTDQYLPKFETLYCLRLDLANRAKTLAARLEEGR